MKILGLGKQDSLRSLVELAEQEYCRMQTPPARLVLQAEDVQIEGTRLRTDAPFESWTLRLPLTDLVRDAALHIQRQYPELCSMKEAGPCWEVAFRRAAESTIELWEPMEKLYDVLSWPEVWRVQGEDPPRERLSVERLFRGMRKRSASDIHLYPGAKPVFRVNNRTRVADDLPAVTQRQVEELVRELAPEAAWNAFQRDQQCSFNYRQIGLAYARVSAFIKAGVPHCTIRYLAEQIPTFEELHIPRPIMERLASVHEGLLLVSGMTGSGKSTTVASLIDWINENRAVHIITIEAPVEFVHVNKRAIVSQRNVGTDTPTAIEAVHGAVRHDPDIIVIGEMRDSDTIRAAIDAAGTGHLVISTFHANNAAEVPNRIVSFFNPAERDLVRLQLRDCLRCVISQRLVPRKSGGRVPALEFLFKDTVQIEECLLTGDTAALRVAMQQGFSESSIFEQSLLELVRDRLVAEEVAPEYATNRTLFEQMRLGTYAVPSLETMFARPNTK
jgi:twitching motility protein PilT